MSTVYDTSQLSDEVLATLPHNHVYWLYNGYDCGVTYEIRDKLHALLDDTTRHTYQVALDLQAPYLEMMLRGVRLEHSHIKKVLAENEEKMARLEEILRRYCVEGLGLPTTFNWRSPLQLKNFFYGVLGLKEVKKRNAQGIYAAAVDRETLEHLTDYYIAEPFVNVVLALRDLGKASGFLRTPLDADQRLRCNFNIAGTNTGRLSSSFSDMGTGTNLQNVDRNLKYTFVPDPGKVFVNIDLEQADSRGVGALCWNLFHESHGPEFAGAYLDACESGDLHTTVCRMGWTDLEWGEDPKGWRAIADQIAYRTYSYRDLSKKLGHGTNYYGQPPTMAKHSKIPVEEIVNFQRKYFGAFPCIPEWHKATIEQLQTKGYLTSLFGRRRYFFNRLTDQSTINAAIAYCPQSMTGDAINVGVMNLWRDGNYELLIQVHDSILFQIDQTRISELVPRALTLLRADVPLVAGRPFHIPVEAKVGWNWGDKSDDNFFGLAKWRGEETRSPPKPVRTPRNNLLRSLM
jgi:DNA polymerase-1